MRRLFLPALLTTSLALVGCSSLEKRTAKLEQQALKENSRATEQRRMNAMNYGDVSSGRGAEILVYNPDKKFDPSRSGVGTVREFGTGGARVKDFAGQKTARTGNFLTRMFPGSKSKAGTDREFSTGEAHARGKYEIPNADTEAARKTAETKDVHDRDKIAATRDLHDGDRPYLGPESKKLNQTVSAQEMADWRKGGSESVSYGGTTVERMGNLKQLSIDDVRELLNKNK